MKKRNIFVILLSSILAACAIVPTMFKHNAKDAVDVGDDPIEYSTPAVVSLDDPSFKGTTRAETEEDDDEIGTVSKIVIHYVNDDGKCKDRAFYLWATGVDGVEYSNEHLGADICEYSDDGQSMTITIDVNDARFKQFKGLSNIFYIIKFKMIGTNLNWGGQSDDVQLNFAEFPPINELVEVWATPAAGGGMAQFKTEAETKVDGIKLAKFSDFKTIHCTATDASESVKWDLYAFDQNYFKVKLKKRDAIKNNYKVLSGRNTLTADNKEFDIDFPYTAKINMVYSLVSKEVSSTSDLAKTVYVSFEQLYETPKFEKYYCYEGDDLGMTYNEGFTTFKVWSPISANMTLQLFESGNDTQEVFGGKSDKPIKQWFMSYTKGGVWQITVLGNLEGYYYCFQVDNYAGTTTTVDPYVQAVGCNGLRGFVYDKNSPEANPDGWEDVPQVWDGRPGYDITTPQELSVYEVHVRDFTEDSSWNGPRDKAGKYLGFVEKGTKLAGYENSTDYNYMTGYDHLSRLGINTVQLMPVFDSDNDESPAKVKYNWGYNPQNYNAVEGAYCSDPHNGYTRIKEYKQLIMGLANPEGEKHIRVTMDVVYNHVSSVSASPFTKLMPRYYFRYDENGELYDGSGCHNEVKSEAKMMSKFIIDSVYMWAKEYKIKGFRFDLMGLIDYATLNKLRAKLATLDRDIYLYGEGWTSGGYHGSSYNTYGAFTWQVYKYCNNFDPITGYDNEYNCYLGGFNDTGRNAVKGDNGWGEPVYPGKGFMQKSFDEMYEEPGKIADMVWGIHRGTSNYAKQTVNYISCHDNWTVVDQMWQTMNSDTPANIHDIVRASLASHALVFASNGIAFMLGGEEIYRTKEVSQAMIDRGDVLGDTYTPCYGRYVSHNSYNSPIEVNSFKWNNKLQVSLGGDTVYNENHGEIGGFNYNMAWQTLCHLHEQMTFSAPKKTGDIWPGNTTSAGNQIDNIWWQVGSSGMGIQFDEVFVYVCGRYQSSDKFTLASDNVLFEYGTNFVSDYERTMGTDGYGYGVCVVKRG